MVWSWRLIFHIKSRCRSHASQKPFPGCPLFYLCLPSPLSVCVITARYHSLKFREQQDHMERSPNSRVLGHKSQKFRSSSDGTQTSSLSASIHTTQTLVSAKTEEILMSAIFKLCCKFILSFFFCFVFMLPSWGFNCCCFFIILLVKSYFSCKILCKCFLLCKGELLVRLKAKGFVPPPWHLLTCLTPCLTVYSFTRWTGLYFSVLTGQHACFKYVC